MNAENHVFPARFRPSSLSLVLLLVTGSGCHERTEQRPEAREGSPRPSLIFTGPAGSSARVTRARTEAGGERLHGETRLPGRCVVEDATLDAHGKLTRASMSIADRCDAAPSLHVTLDATTREVRTVSAEGAITWQAPAGAPWIYAPPFATPVSAWVTARAAQAAPAVRLIEATSRRAALVARDQIAIETEQGVTVIVGNDGADVDAVFVDQVRAVDAGVTLARSKEADRS